MLIQGLYGMDTVKNGSKLIAAGPLSKQRGTRAYRVVLVERKDEFVVYNQGYAENEDGSTNFEKSDYFEGSYFLNDQIVEAVKAFSERVARHSKYLASLLIPTSVID